MKTKLSLCLVWGLVSSAGSQVLPPDTILFGKDMAEFAAEWHVYNFSLSTNQDPVYLPAGSLGDPVYFLAGDMFAGPGAEPVFTVPEGVYVFFPIVTVWADNVDTYPPLSVEELRDAISGIIDLITGLEASIDGVPVPDMLTYRKQTPVFSAYFESADSIYTKVYEHPILELVDPIVADGYYLMLEPLPVGEHRLVVGAEFDPPLTLSSFTTVFHIRIEPVSLEQKLAALIALVDGAHLENQRRQPLGVSLVAAGASFESEKITAGIGQLRAFQHKVRAQITPLDPGLAEALIASAQGIIEQASDPMHPKPPKKSQNSNRP